MAPYLEKAMARIPISAEVGVRTFFCGPESFTPDLQPVVGEAPELRNYFVAAGLNSIGILTGGGLGRALAQWIVDGRPDIDVTGMNIDRLHAYQANPEYRATRTVESLGLVYQSPLPGAVDADRARGQAVAGARPAGRAAARTSATSAAGRAPTGTPGAASVADPGRADLGPAGLVRPYWAAEHHAARDRRDPHGHVVHVEVPGAGARRRARCWSTCRPTGSTASRA